MLHNFTSNFSKNYMEKNNSIILQNIFGILEMSCYKGNFYNF